VSYPISTCPTSDILHIYLPNKCHIPYLLAQLVSYPMSTWPTSVISHIYSVTHIPVLSGPFYSVSHTPMTSGPTTVSLTSQWQVAQLQCHSHPSDKWPNFSVTHIPVTSGPTTVSLTPQWQFTQLQSPNYSHPTTVSLTSHMTWLFMDRFGRSRTT
jgi:hypothetical protein